jgi:head-tail adaptor
MPSLNAQARASYKAIGDRHQRVTLWSATLTVDALGGTSEVWAEYGSAWGAVSELPFAKDEANAAMLRIVEIPYRSDVQTGHRVSVGTLTLKILLVGNPELRNKALQLHCGEVV